MYCSVCTILRGNMNSFSHKTYGQGRHFFFTQRNFFPLQIRRPDLLLSQKEGVNRCLLKRRDLHFSLSLISCSCSDLLFSMRSASPPNGTSWTRPCLGFSSGTHTLASCRSCRSLQLSYIYLPLPSREMNLIFR